VCSSLELVLDHTALIPCSDKPEEEKQAIRRLGDILPSTNTTWYVTGKYLKHTQSTLGEELKEHHPLPKLQSSLQRALQQLLGLTRSRSHHCKNLPLSPYGEMRLKLHVISRNAHNDPERRRPKFYNTLDELRDTYRIGGEDVEVISIALLASIKTRSTVTLITTDRGIIEVVEELKRRLSSSSEVKYLRLEKPSELLAWISCTK
jgi:hypothetical protein